MHKMALIVAAALVVPATAWAEPTAPAPTPPTAPAPAASPREAPAANTAPPAAGDAHARSAQDEPPTTYQPPTVVDYYGGRIPRDSTLEERPRTAFVATGISMAGAAYAASLLYAIGTCGAQMECRNGSAWLYAPLMGPFMAAGQAPTSGGRALAIFDGSLQTVGVALFIAGFLAPKKVVVTYNQAAVRVEPMSMGAGMGLGLTVKNM